MSQMIKQLYTAGGPLKLVYLPHFVNCIAIEKMNDFVGNIVYATKLKQRVGVFNDFEFHEPAYVDYQRMSVEPKQFMQITGMEIAHLLNRHTSTLHQRKQVIEALLADDIKQAICDEFKIIVAKTNPTFFLKDLNIQSIQDLANKYYMEFGDDNAYGIEMSLSPFQKYFIICSDSDFKFHYTYYNEMSTDSVSAEGALINYNPTRFIMGRYENLVYMKELSAMQIYTEPK